MKLTREERRRIFSGNSTALRRSERPEVEINDKLPVSWTRGGRQVLDREKGIVVDIARVPTVWIEVTEIRWQEGEWLIRFRLFDHRQHERFIKAGGPATRKPVGLKTRLRPPEKVPRREKPEAWTAESERGYSSTSKGAADEASAVPDAWLQADYLRREVETANSAKQLQQRARQQKMHLESERRAAIRCRSRKKVHDLTEQIERLDARLDDAA